MRTQEHMGTLAERIPAASTLVLLEIKHDAVLREYNNQYYRAIHGQGKKPSPARVVQARREVEAYEQWAREHGLLGE